MRDEGYRDFSSRLIPTVEKSKVIGVRMPDIRRLAAELYREGTYSEFICQLPHEYHEENLLHGALIEKNTDFDACLADTEGFLPYIDNWAVCDMLRPKCFAKNRDRLLCAIDSWLNSKKPYTVRFGIVMLMTYFLDEAFSSWQAKRVSEIKSEHYYVKMAAAWYFATALAKQYDAVRPYFDKGILDEDIRKMAVRKARDSFRIEQKVKEEIFDLGEKI